jgi:hypothetical protein
MVAVALKIKILKAKRDGFIPWKQKKYILATINPPIML